MEKLTHSQEDYLEAIFLLAKNKKIVRVRDLEKRLKVKSASVIFALKRLESLGLLNRENYGYIELTPYGERKAAEIYEKHHILFRFFSEVLTVTSQTADSDACQMEHYMSPETFEKFFKFIRYIELCPKGTNPKWLGDFRTYLETGTLPNGPKCEND